MKKIILTIWAVLALSVPFIVKAVQITVPSAPGYGYILQSTSTGAYVATTTNPLYLGSIFANSTTSSSTIIKALSIGSPFASSTLTIINENIAETQSDANGLLLDNPTSADGSNDQFSPPFRQCGQGWPASVGVSQTDCIKWELQPIAGGLNSSSVYNLYTKIGAAAYQLRMAVESSGDVGFGGVTAPTARVHVLNTGSGSSFLVEDSASTDTSPFQIDASGNGNFGSTTISAKLGIQAETSQIPFSVASSSGATLFALDTNGIIKASTTSTYNAFYGMSPAAVFQTTAGGTTVTMIGAGSNGNGEIYLGASNPLRINATNGLSSAGFVNYTSFGSIFNASAISSIPLKAKGYSAGQTADLFQVNTSADVSKFKVTAAGESIISTGSTANDFISLGGSSNGVVSGSNNSYGKKWQIVTDDGAGTASVRLASNTSIAFNSGTNLSSGSTDTGIVRDSAGVVSIRNMSAGAAVGSVGTLNVGNITAGSASSTYAGGIDAARVCITGTTTCLGGSGGSQTPWTSNIDGAGYNLTGVNIASSTEVRAGNVVQLGGSYVNASSTGVAESIGATYKNGYFNTTINNDDDKYVLYGEDVDTGGTALILDHSTGNTFFDGGGTFSVGTTTGSGSHVVIDGARGDFINLYDTTSGRYNGGIRTRGDWTTFWSAGSCLTDARLFEMFGYDRSGSNPNLDGITMNIDCGGPDYQFHIDKTVSGAGTRIMNVDSTTIDMTTATVNMSGDLNVTGKVTATGGFDPPYVLYDAETRESVRGRSLVEIPLEKQGGGSQFYNKALKRMEVYVAEEDKFYTVAGALIVYTSPTTKAQAIAIHLAKDRLYKKGLEEKKLADLDKQIAEETRLNQKERLMTFRKGFEDKILELSR